MIGECHAVFTIFISSWRSAKTDEAFSVVSRNEFVVWPRFIYKRRHVDSVYARAVCTYLLLGNAAFYRFANFYKLEVLRAGFLYSSFHVGSVSVTIVSDHQLTPF